MQIESSFILGNLMQARLCVNGNIPVVPVPGACAFVAALSASGLATDEFAFGMFNYFSEDAVPTA